MNVSAITSGPVSPARTPVAMDRLPESAGREQTREAIGQFIASAFVIPVLKQLRESSLREGPFAPGDAERRFGPLLDERIADQVVRGANFPLVDRIAERYASIIDARAQMESLDVRA